MRLCVLIPILRDWHAVSILLQQLDQLIQDQLVHIIIVNDSAEKYQHELAELNNQLKKIDQITLISWKFNLSNQTSIAMAIKYVYQNYEFDALIPMDGDGEDNIQDFPKLIKAYHHHQGQFMIWARRGRRSEGALFKFFYYSYRWLFKFFIQTEIKWGHYSIIPRQELSRIMLIPELELHFPAALLKHRMVYAEIVSDRAKRIAGRPSTNFIFLITHAFKSFAIFYPIMIIKMLKIAALTTLFSALLMLLLPGPWSLAFLALDLGVLTGIILCGVFLLAIKSSVLIAHTNEPQRYIHAIDTILRKNSQF